MRPEDARESRTASPTPRGGAGPQLREAHAQHAPGPGRPAPAPPLEATGPDGFDERIPGNGRIRLAQEGVALRGPLARGVLHIGEGSLPLHGKSPHNLLAIREYRTVQENRDPSPSMLFDQRAASIGGSPGSGNALLAGMRPRKMG